MNVFDEIKNEEGDQSLLFIEENNLNLNDTKINLSDFNILTKLGKGGFGSVAKVRCKLDNKIYALKIIEKQNDNKKYNYREIQMFQKLKHPNIIKYYGCFEDDNNIYLIIEYMENGSLTKFIGGKSRIKYNAKIPNELVWNLFLQSISGLVYIHSQKIIHRDIKPDNLLIDNNMKLKITDFGISKTFEKDKNNFNTVLGVQNHYSAPETHQDNPNTYSKYYNEKVDIYSLGKTFQEFYDIMEKPDDKKFYNLFTSMMKIEPNERPSAKEVYEQVIKIYNEKNLKNTCMDSLIRCFYSLSPMTSYFLKLSNANNKNIIKTDFKNCLEAFTDKDINKWFIAVEQLRHSLEKQNPCLETKNEIEPFILFSFLFKELNNELNKSIINNETKNRHIINNELVTKNNKEETKLNFINNFLLKQNSYITNNFMGLIKEIRLCESCQLKTYKFKSYFSITFDLLKMHVNNGQINLEDCFAYEKQEQHSKNLMCSNCIKINSHIIHKYYYSSPLLLIIHIKNDSLNKASLYINEIIDLEEHFEFENLPRLFALKGILKNKEGKYISNININNTWFLCEGKKIKKIEFKSTKENNENIIMLFYQSIK